MAVDRWEPLVYEAWLREATRAIFADELDEAFEEWWGARPETLLHALTSEQTLCNDTRTPDVETCGQTLAAALRAALDWTAARYGSDRRNWRWGDAHMATFRHPVFGRVPLLGDRTNIRTPAAGGQHTVNLGGFMVTDPVAPFEMVFGPAYRAVYDLSDLDRSLFIVAPGQSGNPLSPHYGDLVDVWREGRYLTLVPPDDPAHMLRLMPAGTER
jgi:penicillin amidase